MMCLRLSYTNQCFSCRPFFLSINRFERKKNIGLALLAFALMRRHHESNERKMKLIVAGMHVPLPAFVSMKNIKFQTQADNGFFAGGYDKRLKENHDYLEELKQLSEDEGIMDHVVFLPSCSTEKRDELLATCLCLVYTPTVSCANPMLLKSNIYKRKPLFMQSL